MKLLALDQSSNITGYAVFDDEELIAHGIIDLKTIDVVGVRLMKLRSAVLNLINQYEIEEVVFEDIQLEAKYNNNVATFKVLAETFGVLYELFTELKLPSTSMYPTEWRKPLSMNFGDVTRKKQKQKAQAYVLENYNVQVTEDAADAICIGAGYLLKNNKLSNDDFDWL